MSEGLESSCADCVRGSTEINERIKKQLKSSSVNWLEAKFVEFHLKSVTDAG